MPDYHKLKLNRTALEVKVINVINHTNLGWLMKINIININSIM